MPWVAQVWNVGGQETDRHQIAKGVKLTPDQIQVLLDAVLHYLSPGPNLSYVGMRL